jgi:long-chain acyl-CoA synthetase
VKPYVWNPWLSARNSPERLAVAAGQASCTFAELVDRADRLGSGLAAAGLAEGAVVSTDLRPGPRFFALALAALRYGYGLFPVSTRVRQSPAGRRLLADAHARMHVSVGDVDGSVPFDDLARPAARPEAGRAPRAGFLVFATSGTTGEPRAVVRARPWYPYRGVAVDARYGAGLGHGPHVMAQPTFHLGTLGPALYALQAGSGVVVQPTWSPGLLAELVDRFRADTVFLTVDHLADVVSARCWAGRRVAAVFHGGAACTPYVKREAITLMGPVLHEYYGTSECVVSEITSAEWLAQPGSVGRPLPGVRVWAEHDGARLGEGEVGELCVAPRAVDRRRADDVVRTGDLGFQGPGGYLFVIGRVHGNQSAGHALLEHAIRSLPGVTDAVVLAGEPAEGTATTCFVEGRPELFETLREHILAVAADRAIQPVTLDLRPIGAFPRSANGKLQRPILAGLRHQGLRHQGTPP